MSDVSLQKLDELKIKKAVQTGVPVSITTYTLPHEMEVYMNEVLTWFLRELNQQGLTDYLIYCTNELTTNAKKANTKRIFFREKKLDINKEADYQKGMADFKRETLSNIEHYLQLQEAAGLYIKMSLQIRGGKIRLEVRNNSELNIFEYKRIHDKLMKAQQYSSMQDAFSQVLDETEGAGLGLIIMILMLQKIGLSWQDYRVNVENGETIVDLSFPLVAETRQQFDELSREIVDAIDELPQFPENIMAINHLLNDPDATLSDIAAHIGNDMALTADLLRLVNSAAYGLATKCQNIQDAVKLIGIRGVKGLMYSLGTIKVLGDSTPEKKRLWRHSYQVAFYTYSLSRAFCRNEKNIVGDAYVCGLLHDIGKIIFNDAHPELLKKFEAIRVEKNIPEQFLEKLIGGVNHEVVGMQIAQKWNFPDVIAKTIRYHHEPEEAPAEIKKLTYLISLADMIAHFQDGTFEFYQFDKRTLDAFNIADETALLAISERLQIAFENEQKSS